MIFEACSTARDAISRVLKRGNHDENQRNSLVDGPCAHARTLIADFCPILRCDGVIKSPFNSRAGCVCVCVCVCARARARVCVCPHHTHIYTHIYETPDNESTVKNVVRISEELVRQPTPPLARLIIRSLPFVSPLPRFHRLFARLSSEDCSSVCPSAKSSTARSSTSRSGNSPFAQSGEREKDRGRRSSKRR